MLDVHRLELLRELSIRGTMAAVADALKYSPSAVSQQLTLLEKEAGTALFRKVGRRVQLTPQAEILVSAAGELADVLERAEAELQASHTTIRGRVRVAVFQSAALALMPDALLRIAEQHPELRVEMVQKEPEEALHETWARDFDLVIAEQYPAHSVAWLPGLHRRDLTSDDIRLAVPPGAPFSATHARPAVTSLAQARDWAWVMEPPGTASRHFAEQLCRSAGFEPDVRYETADLQTHIRLVESGNAVALLPDLLWTGREITCTLLPLAGHPRRTIFTAQREAGRQSPAVEALRSTLEAVGRETLSARS